MTIRFGNQFLFYLCLGICIPLITSCNANKTSLSHRQKPSTAAESTKVSIIPRPVDMKVEEGFFLLKPDTVIVSQDNTLSLARNLSKILSAATDYYPRITKENISKNSIVLQIDPKLNRLGEEGYKLNITPDRVMIQAPTPNGIFYGIVTIRQLLPAEIFREAKVKNQKWTMPCLQIEDYPRFSWRGMMLDVSRYFMDIDYVKHYLDMMAMHKMNVLHLHLVDDCGWRVEIDKYPRLTEVGGFRGTGVNRSGGFYSKQQVRQIVDYATKLHIDIVPEIELPAHCQSALVAYPWLGCTGQQFTVPTKHSISHEILCGGKESTYEFLENVMSEVVEMFPSKFIHVGGDEARYTRWEKCADCKKKMTEQGYSEFKELQGYMTRRMEKFMMKKGKRLIGWDEILDCGMAPNGTVMTWHRSHTAAEAAKAGNNVVMALTSNAYFDTPESNLPGEPPAATWLTPISLQKAYQWEPVPEALSEKEKKRILGGHGCLWTDQFLHKPFLQDMAVLNENRSARYVDYLTLPRMAALAEVVWTPKAKRSWEDFRQRQGVQYNRYDAARFHYRVPLPMVEKPVKTSGGYKITLINPVKDAEIRYTTDGTYPTAYSAVYTGPITIDDPKKFAAITVVSPRHLSLAFKFPEDKSKKYVKYGLQIGEWKSGKVSAGVYKPVRFDATGKIDKSGTYEITFIYTHGVQRLDIEKVRIIVSGKVVAEDKHYGTTGGHNKHNTYRLKIDSFETGANYIVEATVMGDTGNDSNGLVFLKYAE